MTPLVLQIIFAMLAPATLAGVFALRFHGRGRRDLAVLLGAAAVTCGLFASLIGLRLLFPCAPKLCLLRGAVELVEARTLVEDRYGRSLAALESGLTPWVPLEHHPSYLRNAVLQREDRRFDTHRGVDPVGVLRAVGTLRGGGRTQGASTVAMQAAQCLVGRFGPRRLPPEERFTGKLAEVSVGAWMIHHLGHDRTLEIYLNCVPLAGGRGMEAAARFNFGVGVREVTWEQAMLLAAMIRNPAHTNPVSNPERARREVRLFRDNLMERGVLDPDAPSEIEPGLKLGERRFHRTPFSDPVEVLRGEVRLRKGASTVRTTLDRDLQFRAWNAVHEMAARADAARPPGAIPVQVAFVAMDAEGGIRAYVAGRGDTGPRGYDRVRAAGIRPASVEKPLILADALDRGDIRLDTRTDELRCPDPARDAWLQGISARSDPTLTLERALAVSDNWMAVCLVRHLARGRGREVSRQYLPPYTPDDLSTALGTRPVSPIRLAEAYVALLAGGSGRDSHLWKATASSGPSGVRSLPVVGGILSAFDSVRRFATRRFGSSSWSATTSADMRDALEAVMREGTGRGAAHLQANGVRVGLKTGTATGRDGRAEEMVVVGFVDVGGDLVIGLLWLGLDEQAPLHLGGGAARHLVPVWAQIMGTSR